MAFHTLEAPEFEVVVLVEQFGTVAQPIGPLLLRLRLPPLLVEADRGVVVLALKVDRVLWGKILDAEGFKDRNVEQCENVGYWNAF